MDKDYTSENKAVIDFVKENNQIAFHTMPDGNVVASVPQGRNLASIQEHMDRYLDAPRRLKGTSQHDTVKSFIAHANRHKDASSVVFASGNAKEPKLMAVYNYNEAVPQTPVKEGYIQQRFGDHRAILNCRLSDEWLAWKEQNKTGMSQVEFAEFIEGHILDVQDPPDMTLEQYSDWKQLQTILGYRFAKQQQIMQLSRGLTVFENCKVGSAVNLASGEQSIVFESEHVGEDGKKLDVPQLFMIGIPVFKDGRVYRFAVRLRYRKASSLSWQFDIYRLDDGFKTAYDDVCYAVEFETKLPVFVGCPE